jgi:DNA polymerase-1
MSNKPVIYIDGLNVFMRHFAANPTKSLNGNLCGAIVGFLRNIEHLSAKFNPQKIVVAWEGGGSLRRRSIDPDYKNGRRPVRLNRSSYYSDIPDTSENRNNQLKILIEILYETPVTQIYVSDCEADDVISYLTKTKNVDHEKIIVTSDKDYYQLLDENTKIWSPNKKILIDKKYVLDKWSVPAYNFCLVRCFAGDTSDGIKGIKGAGIKTMVKRFPELTQQKEMSISDIINESSKKVNLKCKIKLYENIINNKLLLHKNWKLMYLDSAMLSADQVKKINHQYDNKESSINKMNLLKIMNREGLNFFNIHTFLIALKSSLRNKIQ